MGFMDSLKKATGVGLTAHEHYDRAYEKGVLLGPEKFDEAVGLFETAARKAAESGDVQTQVRAVANARLYGFITSGDVGLLPDLHQALSQLTEIEQIGSRSELMSAETLRTEVEARLAEHELGRIAADAYRARAEGHRKAAAVFQRFFTSPLTTYSYQRPDSYVGTAQERFFFHHGMAEWCEAVEAGRSDPEAAAEHMAKALSSFHQCGDVALAANAQSLLANFRQRRTCWMCHREFQGAQVHFRTYSATVSPYAATVVEQLGQDSSMLDPEGGSIVLCSLCGSAVEQQADRYARQRTEELHQTLGQELAALRQAVDYLASRVSHLERR